MARLNLICMALVLAAAFAQGERSSPRPTPRPEPSRRPEPSKRPEGPPAPGSQNPGGKRPEQDYSIFGFNRTEIPPMLNSRVKNDIEDLLQRAGRDLPPRDPSRPAAPEDDDVAVGIRRAAPEAIRAARNYSMVDSDGRPFIQITSPNGTIIMKTFNALGHARCNITTLLRVADHWVSLPAGEDFIRGIRNDSILVVSSAPHNRHGRGRRNHTVHSDVLDISVTDGNGNEIAVNSSTTVDGATVDTSIVVSGDDTDTKKMSCAWWDEVNQVWSTEGCVSSPKAGFVDCSCSHLTSFALVSGGNSDSSSSNTTAIIAGVLGTVGFIALVIGGVFLIKKMKQRKARQVFVNPASTASHNNVPDTKVIFARSANGSSV